MNYQMMQIIVLMGTRPCCLSLSSVMFRGACSVKRSFISVLPLKCYLVQLKCGTWTKENIPHQHHHFISQSFDSTFEGFQECILVMSFFRFLPKSQIFLITCFLEQAFVLCSFLSMMFMMVYTFRAKLYHIFSFCFPVFSKLKKREVLLCHIIRGSVLGKFKHMEIFYISHHSYFRSQLGKKW